MIRWLLILYLVFVLLHKPFEPAASDDRQAGFNGGCCPCCILERKEDCDDDCC